MIRYEDMGAVLFAPSRKAKHLSITVKAEQNVRVSVPKGVSLQKAREFLASKAEWVKKHLRQLVELRANGEDTPLPPVSRAKAKMMLTGRLKQLASQYGFSYNRLFIRNQKTKWGSCSSKNNISLNVSLAALPEELRDYVLLHELVHTRIKNHSREFWAELGRMAADAKRMRKELRRYRLGTG